MTEPIADYLKRRVKEAGAAKWDEMAATLNKCLESDDRVTFHSLRKIAFGERPNLGLQVAQALLDYFNEEDKKAKREKAGA